MRTWRVGTFSMGLSIISLGCFLLFSVVKGIQVLDTLTAWWPVLLIILELKFYYTFYFLRRNNHLLNMIFLVFSLSVF